MQTGQILKFANQTINPKYIVFVKKHVYAMVVHN
jgi:hypothetical protein